MEIVAQWLDDLEDLLFALFLAWERLRWRCLQTGLAAALTVPATHLAHVPVKVAVSFACLAIACVAVWLVGLIALIAPQRKPHHA